MLKFASDKLIQEMNAVRYAAKYQKFFSKHLMFMRTKKHMIPSEPSKGIIKNFSNEIMELLKK